MTDQPTPFHATILTGEATLRRKRALELAQALVCTAPEAQRPCHCCRDCRKVQEGIHPDVIPVERFQEEKDVGGELKIGPIRALRADAFVRPNEAACKVYLIDRAEKLNMNAQNALLKLLEEGPAYAAFLLMTDQSGALLETIRSRCAVLNVGESGQEEALDESALLLARCIAGGDALEQMRVLVQLELKKPDRPAQERLLLDLERLCNEAALGGVTGQFTHPEAQRLAQTRSRAQLLDLAQQLRAAQDMLPFHVGAGHLMGWLATKL
jgi:DNA polymerase-3 subunit delta'